MQAGAHGCHERVHLLLHLVLQPHILRPHIPAHRQPLHCHLCCTKPASMSEARHTLKQIDAACSQNPILHNEYSAGDVAKCNHIYVQNQEVMQAPCCEHSNVMRACILGCSRREGGTLTVTPLRRKRASKVLVPNLPSSAGRKRSWGSSRYCIHSSASGTVDTPSKVLLVSKLLLCVSLGGRPPRSAGFTSSTDPLLRLREARLAEASLSRVGGCVATAAAIAVCWLLSQACDSNHLHCSDGLM